MGKFKIENKIAAGAVFLMVVTNPLVAVHVNEAVNYVFDQIIANSGIVGFISLGYLVALYAVNYHKANKLHIPTKAAKTLKAGKLIET